MKTSSLPLQEYAGFAADAARRAGEIALRYFQKLPGVEYKADHSPVTIADRESEQLLRKLIEERYPEHGILGEEFGLTRGEAPLRWYLDPIDGTFSFVHGVPLFGVMVGLAAGDDALLGVVHLPALGETVVAWKGGGCWWYRGSERTRARVSNTARLEDALLLGTDPKDHYGPEKAAAYQRLRSGVRLERGWGDCYGYVLVATGRADIMMDAALHEWDAAPLIPIIEEAGGHFTDWRGRRTFSGGDGLATNGALHEEVTRIIREKI